MKKIEIDGVGTFEVDEGFFKLSPAEQDQARQQIALEVQSGRQEGEYSGPAQPSQHTVRETEATSGPMSGPPTGFENGVVERGRWDTPAPAPTPSNKTTTNLRTPGLVARGMAALNEGLADGFGAPVDLANAALSKVGLGSDEPFLGSKSISGILHKLGIGQTDETYAPQSGAESYAQTVARGLGGAVPAAMSLPAIGGRLAVQSATEAAPTLLGAGKAAFRKVAAEAAKRPGIAVATELASGGGSSLGASVAHDLDPDSKLAPVVGSLVGGLAGGTVAARSTMKRSSGYQADKFVADQRTNPFASHDAEVAGDVKRLYDAIPTYNAAGKKLGRVQREATLTGRLSTLEDSYLPRDAIKTAKLIPSEKAKLLSAMDRRHILTNEEIDGLRSTPAGNAVADGITMSRRLRTLIPEGSPAERRASIAKVISDTALTGAGSLVAGPPGAILARLGARAIDHVTPDSSSAEALAARAVVKQSPRYTEVLAAKGSSGSSASKVELLANAAEAQDAPTLARNAAAAARARETAQAAELDASNRRVGITNDRDNIAPGGGWRGYVKDQTGLLPKDQDIGALRMVAEGRLSPTQLEAFLKRPETLQSGNAGNAIVDRLNAMADDGILSRVEGWTKPQAATASPDANGIRNPIAYRATAEANQGRISQALASVQGDTALPEAARQTISEAVAKLGNTSKSADADALVSATLQRLPQELREYAARVLSPLAQQIK